MCFITSITKHNLLSVAERLQRMPHGQMVATVAGSVLTGDL